MRLLATAALGILFLISDAYADEVPTPGRYQMQLIEGGPPNALYTEVMILDTSTGDLWAYVSQPSEGNMKAVEVIRYISRMRLPDAQGNVIYKNNFGQQ